MTTSANKMTEPKSRGDLTALRVSRDDEPRRPATNRSVIMWLLGVAAAVTIGLVVYERWIAPRNFPTVEAMIVRSTVAQSNAPLLTVTGYLVADRQATIAPAISGRLVELHVETGQKVGAGDVLAVIESDALQAQLKEAAAMLEEASRDYARQRVLYRQGITSRANLDAAEARLGVAKARKSQIEVSVRDSVVRAPFNGTVTEKTAELGEMVAPFTIEQQASGNDAGTIAKIVDLDTLQVEADVNETNLGRIRQGNGAEISVEAFPARKWRGRLDKIVPTADRAKGAVKVRVAILDPHPQLIPEMSSTVVFLENQTASQRPPSRIWIPESALLADPSGARVFVIGPDARIEVRRAVVGESRDDLVEIVSGLRDGERIAISNLETLTGGQRVRVSQEGER